MFVSARYTNPENTQVAATDEHGQAWSHHIDSQIGDWLEYRAKGGTIAPYVPPVPTETDINSERSRRILAGKVIAGVYVKGREEDQRNLTNLALAAQVRLAVGDTSTVTIFRDGNNVDHELTPPQMLSLWQEASSYVSDLYAASWAIKAMTPIPADFAKDQYWPTATSSA